jgi:uncharacterized protein YbbK (DUF523 family)
MSKVFKKPKARATAPAPQAAPEPEVAVGMGVSEAPSEILRRKRLAEDRADVSSTEDNATKKLLGN